MRVRLGIPLHVVVVLVVLAGSTAEQDCSDSTAGYSLPCNQNMDPWKQMRTKVDSLTSEIEINESAERGITMWMRIRYGNEKVNGIVNTPQKLSKTAKEVADKLKEKTEEAAEAATKAAEKVKETAKKATTKLQKAAKLLGALASAAQFVGPIIDIVLLFSPLAKSRELKAIESGFAKMGAKIDSVSYKLENIQGALDWNAIVSQLIEFEATVDHTMTKYNQLFEDIKALDPAQELPLIVKSHIEDLVEAIKDTGDIGTKLQFVENLFKGTSGFTKGQTLLEMFIEAVDNDCSKILPMANKLIAIVKDAQRLQYFYELNQQLIKPDDDKGYPKMLYEMYKESITKYTKCSATDAATNAQKEMKVLYGNDEKLVDIIDKLEPKYDLYNWAAMKEGDKKEEYFALIDNSARKLNIKLSGLSEDEQEKQRLTLFAVKKSSRTEVENAIGRVQKVLVNLNKSDLPQFDPQENWDYSETLRSDTLNEVRNLFKKDAMLKSLIDNQRMTMVMFKNDSDIDLHGWHYKSNMEVLKIIKEQYGHGGSSYKQRDKYLGFTIGFSFNFAEDTSSFKCINGHRIDMSFEGSFPYCLCDMDYGGAACDISLKNGPASSLSNSVLNLVRIYKVPGMFDLQDDIRKGTNEIMQQMENNKREIFSVARQTGTDIEKSKNAILSAQSIMLNDLKAGNARLLREFAGLGAAMEAALERDRNDIIYSTEKGQKVVIKTIGEANKKVTDSIKQLTGRVIENRYFKELKLHIPVYQEKFERAIGYGGYAEKDFSDYLELHEQNFRASKVAAKKAIVERTDSFVMAQMQINMVSGCTDAYTEQIATTWAEMMELHLAMNTMELWDLDYKIRTSTAQDEVEFLKHEKESLEKTATSDTNEFKSVYKTRSCPAFSLPDLVGGGCGASITYPGQSVPMQCSDPNKSLVLVTTGDVVTEVVCQSDSTWAVNVADLRCVTKCVSDGQHYDIGGTRRLPNAPPGYYFADEDGNVVTESTCTAPRQMSSSLKAERGCVKENIDFGGADMSGMPLRDVGSIQKCIALCTAKEGCLSVTHQPATSSCWLKHKALGDRPAPMDGVNSWNMLCGDWKIPVRGASEFLDMRAAPLQIKTDSTAGSGDLVYVRFVDAGIYAAGGLKLHFTDPMEYELTRCTDTKQPLNNVPGDKDKIWAVYRTLDSVKIECNDVEVAEFSIASCSHGEKWVYDRDIAKVIFEGTDTATDFYSQKERNCQEDDDQKGLRYRGHTSVTKSGRECQRWDSQSPNSHSNTPTRRPSSGLRENYCRNPSSYYAGLWCYSNEGTQPRWELCDVPRCSSLSATGVLKASWSKTRKTDVDECRSPGFCGFGGTCTNTAGSFTCTCPAGFSVGSDGKCQDVDECAWGGVGYTKCLVQNTLGACENTDGSYRCACLAGSYTNANHPGKECIACSCNSNGVTNAVCNGQTGACLCNANVGGADCGNCKPGFATFPYCTQCAAGYYRYPDCVQCDCVDSGVTAQYCSAASGQCLCKENVAGARCDHCKPHYKSFPACLPDVKDGTLSAWSAWSAWADQGKCGPSYMKGYNQKRTRTRTCDDSTKNIHGRSCAGDILEEVETRFHAVCKSVAGVFITLHTDWHSGTTAYLWMGIRQGTIKCSTVKPTWDAPDEEDYQKTYWKWGQKGCSNTFDHTKKIDIYLYSDSDNDVYVTKMGARIGTTDKTWYTSGSYTAIDDDENNGWYTTTS